MASISKERGRKDLAVLGCDLSMRLPPVSSQHEGLNEGRENDSVVWVLLVHSNDNSPEGAVVTGVRLKEDDARAGDAAPEPHE